MSPEGCPECRQRQQRYQQGETSYHSARWKRASAAFKVAHPFCVNHDKGIPTCTLVTDVTDHRIPHEGDAALFWDRANWQPMCASCHSVKTAAEVRGRT